MDDHSQFDSSHDSALASLREADPARGTQPIADPDAMLARILAAPPERRQVPFAPIVAGGALSLVAVGIVTGAVMMRGGSSSPTAAPPAETEIGGGGGFAAMCVELYSPETLVNREWAFEGVVDSIDADTFSATFTVTHWLRGDLGEQVTLGAGTLLGVTSVGDDTVLVPGDRYLISGDETFAWGCGFSQPYSEALAAEWETALGE